MPKQQQAQHTPSSFPDLSRLQLEELCLRQNQNVADLLAAARKCLNPNRQTSHHPLHADLEELARAVAKAEGR